MLIRHVMVRYEGRRAPFAQVAERRAETAEAAGSSPVNSLPPVRWRTGRCCCFLVAGFVFVFRSASSTAATTYLASFLSITCPQRSNARIATETTWRGTFSGSKVTGGRFTAVNLLGMTASHMRGFPAARIRSLFAIMHAGTGADTHRSRRVAHKHRRAIPDGSAAAAVVRGLSLG